MYLPPAQIAWIRVLRASWVGPAGTGTGIATSGRDHGRRPGAGRHPPHRGPPRRGHLDEALAPGDGQSGIVAAPGVIGPERPRTDEDVRHPQPVQRLTHPGRGGHIGQ